jgi:cyanophycinase
LNNFFQNLGGFMKQQRFSILSASMLLVVVALGSITGQQAPNTAASQAPPEYGPAKGTLVIVGGGLTVGTGIIERFINLAGGPDARFVIVPTAGGNKTRDGQIRVYNEENVVAGWKRRGLKNVRMLHTHDPKVADTEEFIKPLREANAVWFEGGRQWNIVDSYMNTATYREFHKVLERGGVIGGSSAGATIQGDYLVRGAIAGPDIMMTPEPEHEHGFKFLRKSAIDQHINTRNRWDDLIPVIKKYPNLLGIGLSEDTAIIVNGDRFEVMGVWKVAIHDNSRVYQPWEKPYYVLSAGDVYNMKTRQVEKYGNGARSPAQQRPIAEGTQPKRDPEKP